MNLLEKLGQLRDWLTGGKADVQDVAQVDGWIAEAKRLFLLKSLKDHDGIKYVLEIFQSEVDKINDQLLNQRQMFEDERYRLLDQRALAQKYLNLFLPIEDDLAALEEKVDLEKVA